MFSDWILDDQGRPLKLLVQVDQLSEISSDDKSYFLRLPWPVYIIKNTSEPTVDIFRFDSDGPSKVSKNISSSAIKDYIKAHR